MQFPDDIAVKSKESQFWTKDFEHSSAYCQDSRVCSLLIVTGGPLLVVSVLPVVFVHTR